jgi:hypothetical protein
VLDPLPLPRFAFECPPAAVRLLEVPTEEATTGVDVELAVGVARTAGAALDAGGIDVDVVVSDTSGVDVVLAVGVGRIAGAALPDE